MAGSLNCFVVIKDQERLNVPVITFINMLIRLFCNNVFNV